MQQKHVHMIGSKFPKTRLQTLGRIFGREFSALHTLGRSLSHELHHRRKYPKHLLGRIDQPPMFHPAARRLEAKLGCDRDAIPFSLEELAQNFLSPSESVKPGHVEMGDAVIQRGFQNGDGFLLRLGRQLGAAEAEDRHFKSGFSESQSAHAICRRSYQWRSRGSMIARF